MEEVIRKAQCTDLNAIKSIAAKTIRECYKVFFTEDIIDWFIKGKESDKE